MIDTSASPQAQGANAIKDIKKWLSACPPFTKTLYYIFIILAIPEFLSGWSYIWANIPAKIVRDLQITRLILSPFFCRGIVETIFCLFAYLPLSAKLEKEWGTVRTAVDFLWMNFVINITWIIFGCILSSVFWYGSCSGLMPPLFALIMRDLANPEEVKSFMCFPVLIKARFYPAALWLFASILSGYPRFDCLVAMLVGFIYMKYWKKSYYSFLNTRRMVAWSESCFFSRFRKNPKYIGVTDLPVSIGEGHSGSSRKASDQITDVSSEEYQAPLFQTQNDQIFEVQTQDDENDKIQAQNDKSPEIQTGDEQILEVQTPDDKIDEAQAQDDKASEIQNQDAQIDITPQEQDVKKIEDNSEDALEKA